MITKARGVWLDYWSWYGIGYGLFQAFMVSLWIASGVGLVGSYAWMTWELWP